MRHAGVFQPKAYADSAIQRHGLSDSEPCRLCEFMVQMLIADHHFAMVPFRFHPLESRGGSCQNEGLFQSLMLESGATLRALETIPDTENESIQ